MCSTALTSRVSGAIQAAPGAATCLKNGNWTTPLTMNSDWCNLKDCPAWPSDPFFNGYQVI